MPKGGLLYGRARDVAELEGALEEALGGHGQAAVLVGEAGIGKSWLAAQVAERGRDAGATVAWAGCSAGAAPSFWPWRQLLDRLEPQRGRHPALARLHVGAPVTAPDDPEADRTELFGAVADVLREAAGDRLLVLVVDDLHWADDSSLRLLTFVAPLLRTLALLLVVTVRDERESRRDTVDEVVAELSRHGRRLELGPLTAAEVEALAIQSVAGPLGEGVAGFVHHYSGGNALFARELVRLLGTRQALGDVPAARRAVGVPQGVRAVVTQRLERLPSATRELLDLAAVAGDVIGLDVLQQATGSSAPDLLAGLEPAVAARVVNAVSVGRYAFGHALIRAAVVDEMGVVRRVQLHQQVGEALAALQERGAHLDVADLAYHWLAAAPGGNAARAVRYARAAAEQAEAMLAYERAAQLYDDALSALAIDPTAGDRAGLLLARAEALVASGDLAQSQAVFTQAADVARAAGRADQLARAALGLGAGVGGFEIALFDQDQIRLLEEALDGLGAQPGALRALVLARLSVALAYTDSVARRLALAEAAVAMARECQDPAALAHALAAHCDAIAGPADTHQRLREADEIVAWATSTGDRRLQLLGRRTRLVALLELGDTAGADAEIEAYDRTAGSLRQPLYLWYVPLWRGMRAAAQGRMDEAVQLCDEAARIGRAAGSVNAMMLSAVLRWTVRVEQARPAEAAAAIAELAELVPDMPTIVRSLNTALVAAAGGDADEASRHLAPVLAGIAGLPLDAEWLAAMVEVVDVLRITGPHPVGAQLYGWLLPFRDRHPIDGIGATDYGSVERHLGVLAALQGHHAEAREHLARALAANSAAGHRLGVARSLADIGTLLHDEELVRQAGAAYREMGLPVRAAQVEQLRAGEKQARSPRQPAADAGTLRCEAGLWTATFGDRTVHLPDRKGLHDIAALLAVAGRELHVLDLVAPPAAPATGVTGEGLHEQGDLGPQLDATARAAYRARLAELEHDLAEARAGGDLARAERAAAEHDALVEQLAGAFGMGGRPRRAGDPVERARSTVTRRIRDAIAAVERAHPELGRHLRSAVRTGTYCVYDPERPVAWSL